MMANPPIFYRAHVPSLTQSKSKSAIGINDIWLLQPPSSLPSAKNGDGNQSKRRQDFMAWVQDLLHWIATSYHLLILHVHDIPDGSWLLLDPPVTLEGCSHAHLGVWPAVLPCRLALLCSTTRIRGPVMTSIPLSISICSWAWSVALIRETFGLNGRRDHALETPLF